MALTLTNTLANAMVDNGLALLNTGTVKVYTGTRPATADTALGANTLLATLTFSATAFPAASAGVATANAITSGTAAATGTATFARLFKSDGTTAILDGAVATSGSDINLNSTAIQSGATVSITSMSFTQPKS